jgi:hypothetical protein
MNKRLVVAAIFAIGATIAAPVFASSGYGPAPHYNPIAGAPASQRGQSAQTVHAEYADANANTNAAMQSFGGVRDTVSESGGPVTAVSVRSFYAHH